MPLPLFLPAGYPDAPPDEVPFRTEIHVVGAEPVVDVGAFPARLASDLGALAGSAMVLLPSTVSVVRSGRQTVPVSTRTWYGTTATRSVPAWTLALQGRVQAPGPWNTDTLNRAIARALHAVTRWTGEVDADYRDRIPRDGGALYARFQSGGSGDGTAVMHAATTSIGTPVATPRLEPTSSSAAATQPSAPSTAAGLCTTPVSERFWLRPTATFSYVGPQYPAGTRIAVLADTGQRRNGRGLYRIQVASDGARGYAALSGLDLAKCAGAVAIPENPHRLLPVCGLWTAPRGTPFYAFAGGVVGPRQELARGAQVRLLSRLGPPVTDFGHRVQVFAATVLSGALAGQEGYAAPRLSDLDCDADGLPYFPA